MKIYAPNFNSFFEEVPKTFLPPSLLYCTMNTEAWNVKQDLAGTAVGLQACGQVADSHFSPAHPHPQLNRHTILPTERLPLTAPLAFLILEMGNTTSATCYFPPDVPAATISTVLSSRVSLKAASESSERKAQQGASVTQAPF